MRILEQFDNSHINNNELARMPPSPPKVYFCGRNQGLILLFSVSQIQIFRPNMMVQPVLETESIGSVPKSICE
jgi:hypothetical protein